MEPTNVLFLMCDEMSRQSLKCYGNSIVKTPNIDKLVESGTCFTNAYTPSPICVSARASLATGKHVHQIGNWSSAEPYDGSETSWGQHLIERGHEVTSIGKLHYKESNDKNGFSEEILPMHVYQGVGWPIGLLRDKIYPYDGAAEMAQGVGAGESNYTQYDAKIADKTCEWIRNASTKKSDKPWVLFSSFIAPHYPLVVPQEYYDLYPLDQIEMPRNYSVDQRPKHPEVKSMAKFWNYDDYFDDQSVIKARAAYYGLCSYLDHHIGLVIDELKRSGLYESTRIIFCSDHGEMLGEKGFWGKSVMYEDSVGIPMIISGPGIPKGERINTPVSLIDCHKTIIESAQGKTFNDDSSPSHSLVDIANGTVPQRTVLSEYHDGGSTTGFFMVRMDQWKYIYYVERAPQLFNLETDPFEEHDLGECPDYQSIRQACEKKLRLICDPEKVNAQAFDDQSKKIKELGGKEACLEFSAFNFTPLPA